MISDILTKIRAVVQDLPKADFQVFLYSNSNVFKLTEPNINTVTQVLVRGTALGSNQSFSFDEDTNEVEIDGVSFNLNDPIEIRYTFTKFSDEELIEYIRASLSWLSLYEVGEDDFQMNTDTGLIFPNISKKEEDLVAMIASILINPDFTRYKLSNLSISYPDKVDKETKIATLITRFKHGSGYGDVIQWGDFGLERLL